MEYEQQFSNLIYEYLLKRLQFGYYIYGDSLPTVDILCREFNVSDHTMWSALRRLRADGYISMKNGQFTKVIFKQTERERRDCVIDYFSKRWDAYFDLYRATELFYVPLLIEGLGRMDAQELAYIERLSKRASADDILLFYCYTLQKIENPLILNLFWETSLFLGFPFVKPAPYPFQYDVTIGREQFKTLVILIRNASWDSVGKKLIQYQRSYIQGMKDSMEQLIRIIPKEEQISFTWRIYRDRPQICYNLASRLLHEIYLGEYRTAEFLPSYEKMAEKYDVSLSTMRRTVQMLNRIGAARSVNGKGTRVFTIGGRCEKPDFTNPVVRRNLSFFIQSYELFLYTFEGVSFHFFQSISAEERNELAGWLKECRQSGCSSISIWLYLRFVSKKSCSQAIRQIYSATYSLFLWGYPLRASLDTASDTDKRGAAFADGMINGLGGNCAAQCVEAIKTYIQYQYPAGKEYLMQNGIEPEDPRLSPSIRLLLVDDYANK